MLFLGHSEIYIKKQTITINEWIAIFGVRYKKNGQRVEASGSWKITEKSICCSVCSQRTEQ
jgi:hypothetical protein